MNQLTRPLIWVALAGVACSGGQENEEGNIAAHRTGSIVTGLAPRGAPDAEFEERCGSGDANEHGTSVLQRLPFAQQVTSNGALIVFQTTQPEAVQVEVTTFDGTPVTTVTAEADSAATGSSQRIATLQGLEPATGYCYSLRGLTGAAGFRTAPAAGSSATVRFAALGDSGRAGSDQRAMYEQLMSVPFDFVLHTGDLAYDEGTAGQLDDAVFRPFSAMLRSFAMYPVAGNHDYQTNDAAPYLQAFVLPENGNAERWYSFDWGDVHFVGLDTEQTGARQADWLEQDLMENQQPWTVVFGHRPPFSSGDHGSDGAFRQYFVPILEKFQVPLVLNGHDHHYERTNVLNGVTYVVTGGGGRGTRPVGTNTFTAFADDVIHFVLVEIAGSRLVLHAIDGTGREFDQTVIERSAG